MQLICKSLVGCMRVQACRHPTQLAAMRATSYCLLRHITPATSYLNQKRFIVIPPKLPDVGESKQQKLDKPIHNVSRIRKFEFSLGALGFGGYEPKWKDCTPEAPDQEFLVNYMPWWLAIMAITTTSKILLFPLILKQNIMGIKTNNIGPETQKLQVKINDARMYNDMAAFTIYSTKLKLLLKEHGLMPWQRFAPLLIQLPVNVSIFFLLRNLSMYPEDGMITGGALWFSNLTIPDPYYILPVLTSATMLLTMEFGFEGRPLSSMGPLGRYGMRSFPLLMLYITCDFPSAVLLFWTTTNSFTLFYAILLKRPRIKKMFNIPEFIKHDPASLPLTNQTFGSQIEKAKKQAIKLHTPSDLQLEDAKQFRKAGIGPLQKTYKEPPKKE